jgi:1-acyl-sn-glycerol-3-phosphate acyltransferase
MFSALSAWIFRVWGWKVTGSYRHDIPKLIVAVAPHTSYWDFPVGVLVRSALKINAKFAGKHTIFVWPLGILMRWLNGIPVDRRKRGNFVSAVVDIYNKETYLHIAIAPEGTRKKVERYKTGFYHIAKLAGIPIILCTFDWGKREVNFNPEPFYPTDNEAADMEYLWNYFKGVQGYHPEKGIH